MKARSPNRLKRERALVITLAVIATAALFDRIWDNLDAQGSYYGTARAPHSDALEPWLHGTLSYYFHNVPIPYLYRPTVGLIFGSLLSSFGSLHIHWVPVFFAFLLLGSLAFYFWCAESAAAVPVALWLLFSAAQFDEVLAPLNIGTLQVDFPSFVITSAGLLLLLLAFMHRPPSLVAAGVAFFLLGMSATIRGPLLLGGPVLLLGAIYLLCRGGRARGIPLISACFFVPIMFDWAIQRSYDLVNNGIIVCFSFYSAPEHTWTPAASAAYELAKPSASEVAARYVTFVFSPEGATIVFRSLFQQFHNDGSRLAAPWAWGVLLLALLCGPIIRTGWWTRAAAVRIDEKESPSASPRRFTFKRLVVLRMVIPCLFLLLIALWPEESGLVDCGFVSWMIVISIGLRLHFAAACLLTYTLSLLFLSLLGLAWYHGPEAARGLRRIWASAAVARFTRCRRDRSAISRRGYECSLRKHLNPGSGFTENLPKKSQEEKGQRRLLA